MLPVWQTGIIREITQVTPNTRRFLIEIPGVENFEFQPGQFVTLDLPISEQRSKRWRSYSIASAPNGTNMLELVIVYMPGGAGTNFLFHSLNVGDKLTLRGPMGTLTLPKTLDKDLYFICTGTGIAPFHSMLQYIFAHNIPHQKIFMIFGTRKREDLLYPDELKALEEKMPGFTYIPVLSREDWDGRKGYVHAVYEELCAGLPPAIFMLCGWNKMVDEGVERLKAMGYHKNDIIAELYG